MKNQSILFSLFGEEKEQFLFYVKNDSKTCPHCDSKEVHIAAENIKKNICIVDLECVDCGREWSENYNCDFLK